MTQSKPTIIFLMGPTASGKTALATYLYQRYPVEIISVDSALIYRGMDIGTAKPTPEELSITPHYLIDIKEPEEIYSAAEFRRNALSYIEQIIAKGKIPLLVGGTMLYFKALLEGLSPLPESNSVIRSNIEMRAAAEGWNQLHQELALVDPIAAARIHPNDPQRLTRALEVFLVTGKSMTELTQIAGTPLPYNVIQLAINPLERDELHQRIETRFLQMLEMGFQSEVEHLMQRPHLHLDLPSMRSVGYRQMWHYVSGEITREEMQFKAVCATRQLAKRQLTWLRSWHHLQWCSPNDYQLVDGVLQQIRGNQKG